ncbi:MAG: hypothetical protein LBU77_02450 [Clostridiales bacterium]|jgi:hypothetical protein|nr:hypothetical protein [Clostridiales bacterium]
MGRSNLSNKLKQLFYKPAKPSNGITAYLGEMSRDIDETFKLIRAAKGGGEEENAEAQDENKDGKDNEKDDQD